MSLEALQAFRSAIVAEPELQKLCIAAAADGNVQRVIDAAAARGFSFTATELESVLADGELSDTELELVAGGGHNGAQGKPLEETYRD